MQNVHSQNASQVDHVSDPNGSSASRNSCLAKAQAMLKSPQHRLTRLLGKMYNLKNYKSHQEELKNHIRCYLSLEEFGGRYWMIFVLQA